MSQSVKTYAEWVESDHSDFDDYCLPFSEVSECIYEYFLEILPPIYCRNGFMVGEPYSFDAYYGTDTYACFVKVRGNFYYLGNISPLAVNSKTEVLIATLDASKEAI